MEFITRVSQWVGKRMVWLIIAVAIFCMIVPGPMRFVSTLRFTPLNLSVTSMSLMLIMFGVGITLQPTDLILVAKRPLDILVGTVLQYIIMPLSGFLLARAFNLSPALLLGMVLLGSVPTGTASNVMTLLAGGDVALSVSLTAVSTLIGSLATPALVYLYARQYVEVDFMAMLQLILTVVVVPLTIGFIVRMLIGSKRADRLKPVLKIVLVASILIIIGASVAPNAGSFLQMSSLLVVVTVFLQHVICLATGYGAAKLLKRGEKQAISISMVVGLRNSGLAVGLSQSFALTMPLAVLPCAIATVVHQIVASLVANTFGKRNEKAALEAADLPASEVTAVTH